MKGCGGNHQLTHSEEDGRMTTPNENSNIDGMLLKSVDYGEYILDLHDAGSKSFSNNLSTILTHVRATKSSISAIQVPVECKASIRIIKDADLVSGGKPFSL